MKMSHCIHALGCGFVALLASGCAVTSSPPGNDVAGVSYYLPKRLVKVSFTRGPTQKLKDLIAASTKTD